MSNAFTMSHLETKLRTQFYTRLFNNFLFACFYIEAEKRKIMLGNAKKIFFLSEYIFFSHLMENSPQILSYQISMKAKLMRIFFYKDRLLKIYACS